MKKGLIKKIGIGLVASALTFLPAKRVDSLENLVDGVGKINGNVIETINENPTKFVDLRLKEYLGNGIIGDELGSCTTDDNGNFSLNIDSSSNYAKIFISKSDSSYYQAERFVNLNEDVLLDIVERHMVDVQPGAYPDSTKYDFMDFFDEWSRFEIPCTHRWTEQPKIFINISNSTQEHIDMAKNVIQNIWPQFTKVIRNGSFISAPYIEEGTVTPDYAKRHTDGWILVLWEVGESAGTHGEDIDKNRIYYADTLFNSDLANKTTYIEELIQVLGPTSEVETRYFYDVNGEMLESGQQIGNFLYSRRKDNKTPDIDAAPKVDIIRYVRPVTNLTVEDVLDDNGNQLELNWNPSISEKKGLVSKDIEFIEVEIVI